MRTTKSLLSPALLSLMLVGGCSGGSSGSDPAADGSVPTARAAGLLLSGGSSDSALDSFVQQADALSNGQPRLAIESLPSNAIQDAAGSSGFSTTYTLEADVDEHDILQYDGELLAAAPTRSGCCFILADALPALAEGETPAEGRSSAIQLFRTDSDTGNAAAIARIELNPDESVEGLYLTSGRLQALMSTGWQGVFGYRLAEPGYWSDQETRLSTYDLTIPENPTQHSVLRIEGALVTSRRTGDEILLITRHTPVIEGYNLYPQTSEDQAGNAEALAALQPEDLLPSITRNDQPLDLLDLATCHRQNDAHPLANDSAAGATITLMLTVSASSGDVTAASCVLEPVTGVYVSRDIIALTYVDGRSLRGATYVHQFRRSDHAYQGSNRVPGYLYGGGNADFRISERNEVLRLITTEFTEDPDDRFDHRLFALRSAEDSQELEVIGTLPAVGDTEIGRPNEDLYGVRFVDDRAYLVTFERTDPFYVVDLADPTRPAVIGELEVPGFSDLLHPVSDALLLGVGQSETGKAKVELFDVSDPTNPISGGAIELGADYDASHTPAQYNRYAFTYLAGPEIDRFTVPYSAWRMVDDTFQSKEAVGLFEIRDKTEASLANLLPVGEVVLPPTSWISGETRAILHGDALYLWVAGQLFGGLWSAPEAVAAVAD